jgi:subtilisin family serine protease
MRTLPAAYAGAATPGTFAVDPAMVPMEPVIAASPPRSVALAINAIGTRLAPVRDGKLPALADMKMEVEPGMDPRLQLAMVNRRSGRRGLAMASIGPDEVAVVARVNDAQAWEGISDVYAGSVLGKASEGFIVTGRIPCDRVAAVRSSPGVLSLKASQPVHASLQKTVESMRVRSDLLPQGVKPKGGAGVVVGIVDIGGDFAHRNFRKADGSTRLLALWHQGGQTRANSLVKYGRLYSPAEINQALASPDPYVALGYGPEPDGADQGAHGTHVMDIAAGNGRGTQLPGVAPGADLIFVEVSLRDISWSGPGVVGKSFGDSVMMLEALRFIFDQAGERPCVINVSLGTNGGPHDGSSLVEQGIDALLREKSNRAVVIAAGNAQLDGVHATGSIGPQGTTDVVWKVNEIVGGEVEFWYGGAGRLEATLIGPDGTAFGPVLPGKNSTIGSGGQPAIFISNRLDDPNNHLNQLNIWIAPDVDGGDWTVRLRSLSPAPIAYHAWIERADAGQGSFKAPSGAQCLGSISTGFESIAVGSYDAHKPGFPLSSFSSTGPTRDGRKKPELSAPGHQVLAAWSRTGDAVTRKSGTSMAAPAVTGLIALIYAEARRTGKSLTAAQLREKLLSGLDSPPPAAGGQWDPGYGQGRACAKAI